MPYNSSNSRSVRKTTRAAKSYLGGQLGKIKPVNDSLLNKPGRPTPRVNLGGGRVTRMSTDPVKEAINFLSRKGVSSDEIDYIMKKGAGSAAKKTAGKAVAGAALRGASKAVPYVGVAATGAELGYATGKAIRSAVNSSNKAKEAGTGELLKTIKKKTTGRYPVSPIKGK